MELDTFLLLLGFTLAKLAIAAAIVWQGLRSPDGIGGAPPEDDGGDPPPHDPRPRRPRGERERRGERGARVRARGRRASA